MTKKKYDINELKRIPIVQVAEKLGLSLIRTGGDTWQVREGDGKRPSSLTLFVQTNSFVRFSGKESGGCSKGSVIDFVCHMQDNDSFKDACAFLSRL